MFVCEASKEKMYVSDVDGIDDADKRTEEEEQGWRRGRRSQRGYLKAAGYLPTDRHRISRALGAVRLQLRVLGIAAGTEQSKGCPLECVVSLIAASINLYILWHNVVMIHNFHSLFKMLHASTVSSIVSGVKPLIGFALVLLFFLQSTKHRRLLAQLDSADLGFRGAFGCSPPIRRYNFQFFTVLFISFALPLALRIVESISTGQSVSQNWLNAASFVLVPLLTVWNVAALIYFDLLNRIVRFWCRQVAIHLEAERKKRQFSLGFYYEQFLKLADIQESVGELFNPFVMFSLAWSLLLLSLTIYFMTEPKTSLIEPISQEQFQNEQFRQLLTKTVYFALCWGSMQVFLAIVHICIICSTGMRTNEETRRIVGAVLDIVPHISEDNDRFLITCFLAKLNTQHMWGLSIWRFFPLERPTFLTLVSLIFSYSFILLKLKENPAIGPSRHRFGNDSTRTMCFCQ